MNLRIARLVVVASGVFAAQLLPATDAVAVHISHCDDGSGTGIYTDGSCRAIGAQPTAMPTGLLRNLTREGELDDQNVIDLPPATTSPVSGLVAHPHVAGCSHTPAQLAAVIRDALASKDVNQLATTYDWTGVSAHQAQPILQRLERMSDRPLIDGTYFDANDGVVQLVQGATSAPTVSEFPVTRRAGCLFLAL